MKVTLCIPTIRRFDLLHDCIYSAITGSRPPDKISIIDNSGGLFTSDGHRHKLDNMCNQVIDVITPSNNLGVARSWNTFLSLYDDIVIISNDDICFKNNLIEEIEKAWYEKPEYALFYPSAAYTSMFALFTLRKEAFTAVGLFDEEFYPAYFEDNDYYYRMRINNLQVYCVTSTDYAHVGSATLKTYTDDEKENHSQNFRRLKSYYIEKWGGSPGEEKYRNPFNE